MEILYDGIVASPNRYKYAVKQNNKSNIIIFKFKKQQDSIVLDPNKHFYVKVRNSGRTFTDKDPNVVIRSTETDIIISWTMLRKVTQFKNIDVEIQYEDIQRDIVWQSEIVNIALFDNIPADKEIEDLYPSILMELQKQIDELKVDIQPPVGGYGIHVTLIDGEHVVSIDENVVQEKEEGKGLSSNDYTNEDKEAVSEIPNKVDKIAGKGLSSNDYTDEDKEAISEIPNKLDKDALVFATDAEVDKLFDIFDFFCIENVYNGNNNITFATNSTLTNSPILEYSFNRLIWTNLTLNQAVTIPVNSKMYVRGNNNSFSESPGKYIHITSEQNINVSGNIMSLLDKTCESLTIPNDYCFYNLFNHNRNLINAKDLLLPATTLANSCYGLMFSDCTSLTTAPALPATILAASCYQSMFNNCTSLTSIPALPATTLTNSCYGSMFRYCAKIKLSTTQTGEYQTPYRIPTSETGTRQYNSVSYMFANTGGTFEGTPIINTTYYTLNEVIE